MSRLSKLWFAVAAFACTALVVLAADKLTSWVMGQHGQLWAAITTALTPTFTIFFPVFISVWVSITAHRRRSRDNEQPDTRRFRISRRRETY